MNIIEHNPQRTLKVFSTEGMADVIDRKFQSSQFFMQSVIRQKAIWVYLELP